jgi:NAD(P)-dependent dehydrogenase (short-subunit alcohol dehydrogenase family)
MLDFTNKTVIITGGGSGIGRAASLLFAKQGAIVHIIELNKEHAEDTMNKIKENGKAFVHICDVSNQQQTAKIFQEIFVAIAFRRHVFILHL